MCVVVEQPQLALDPYDMDVHLRYKVGPMCVFKQRLGILEWECMSTPRIGARREVAG